MVLPPIVIDTRDIMSQYTSLFPGDVERMMNSIAKGLAGSFAQQLEMKAQQELKQTRKRYIQNIKVIDSGRMEGTVMLDFSKDKLVQMIEEGAGAFDMKKYFLASPKAKIGKKGGKYLTIPFRWGVPGTIGESDNFSFIMPGEIHSVVKKMATDVQVGASGMRSAGLSLKDIPQQFQPIKTRPAIKNEDGNILFAKYQHKNNVYQGMTKNVDYATGQNSYRSFRRVSENSDDLAFIHPGIQKYNLIQKVLSSFDIGKELTPLLDNELSKRGLI